jgi:glycosyltransferase involved in cell wall biosynthesis
MVGPFGLRPQGTMSRRALRLAKDLASRGHQIEVLLPPWACPEDSGQVWEEDGVSINNIVVPPSIPILKEVIITWRLLRRIRKRRPHVVHCFKPKAYSGLNAAALWGLAKSRLSKVRVVLDTDDWEGWGGWNDLAAYSAVQKRFFAWQESWGMTHCHALTVASRSLQALAREMGIDDQIIHYLPNGVEPESDAPDGALGDRVRREWQLGDNPVILLFTRFFEFESRRLVEILDQVWAEVPSAHLLVVGRGLFGEEDQFLTLIQEAGLASHVTYVGWRRQQELSGYFAASDLAICPFEDTLLNRARCPAKVADLMAAGLPIVADDVGQVGEYIEHLVSGYLVPPGEVRTFAAGVVRSLHDELLREELGRQARESVMRHFGWPRLAATVERAYAG